MGDSKPAPQACETLSRFFDLIFACGFGFLSLYFIINGDPKTGGLYGIVMIIYYCFFTLFMVASFL